MRPHITPANKVARLARVNVSVKSKKPKGVPVLMFGFHSGKSPLLMLLLKNERLGNAKSMESLKTGFIWEPLDWTLFQGAKRST